MSASELSDDLAIPYVVVMYAVEEDCNWVCHAEYPELPGCSVEAPYALDAIDLLEARRIEMIIDLHSRGLHPPRVRPPLTSAGGSSFYPGELEAVLGTIVRESS